YNFVAFDCPDLTITPTSSSISYSFASDDNVSSYEVVLVKDVIQTSDNYTPSYPATINGLFSGLSPSTGYSVYIKITVGSYVEYCPTRSVNTSSGGGGGVVPGIYG